GDRSIADVEAGGGMQETGLQLTERDRPVRQTGNRGAVQGEWTGVGHQEIEGPFQGVERRVGERAAGGHERAPFRWKEPPSRHAGYPGLTPNRPHSAEPRTSPECWVLAGFPTGPKRSGSSVGWGTH